MCYIHSSIFSSEQNANSNKNTGELSNDKYLQTVFIFKNFYFNN